MTNREPMQEATVEIGTGVPDQPDEVRLMGAIYQLAAYMLSESEVDLGSPRLGRVADWVWSMWGGGRQPDGDSKQCS